MTSDLFLRVFCTPILLWSFVLSLKSILDENLNQFWMLCFCMKILKICVYVYWTLGILHLKYVIPNHKTVFIRLVNMQNFIHHKNIKDFVGCVKNT